MVFDYYHCLTRRRQSIYRHSDSITDAPLHDVQVLRPGIPLIQRALTLEDRAAVELACRGLVTGLNADLGIARMRVRVLAVRPHSDYAELHGLYEPAEGRRLSCMTVWMRTARQKRVVAFRTFLRTVLHEYCHHMDYEWLELAESFHTEGFFKRESALFRQLVAADE